MPDTDNKIVYHYCSLEAFKSIIENKCLWLCDVQKSNDSAECHVLSHAVADGLERRFPLYNPQSSDPSLAETLYSHIMSILRDERDIIDHQIYSISFSKYADQLSQWRGYANDGTGFCIGFNAAYLQNLQQHNFMFRPISYKSTLLNEAVNHYVQRLLELLSQFHDIPVLKIPAHEQLDFFQECSPTIREIQQHAPFFKLQPFFEENESRLCFLAQHTLISNIALSFQSIDLHINNSLFENQHFSIGPLQFRVTASALQSYYELFFAPIKDDFIREIIIGPKCPVQISDIYLFLTANGYNSKINQNNVSLSSFYDNLKIRKSALTYR